MIINCEATPLVSNADALALDSKYCTIKDF